MAQKQKKSFSLNISPLLFLALAALAIPVTLAILNTRLDLRQRASGNTISGVVYADTNKNKIKDSNESGLANVTVEIAYIESNISETSSKTNNGLGPIKRNERAKDNPQPTSTTPKTISVNVLTDASGIFTYQADLAQYYILNVAIPEGFIPTTPSAIKVTNLATTYEFGLYTQSVVTNPTPLPTIVAPTCIPRPTCLDSEPMCMIAEPESGWCPKDIKPTGFPVCPTPPECNDVIMPISNNDGGTSTTQTQELILCPQYICVGDITQ